MENGIDRVRLLRDTVNQLEETLKLPLSGNRRAEVEIALNEAKELLELERRNK